MTAYRFVTLTCDVCGGAMIRTCGSREDAPSRMMIFDETGF